MKNPLVGGIMLFAVVIIWVASSTTIQLILTNYPKPYLLTYITTSMFSCYLLSLLWKRDQIVKKSTPTLYKTSISALKFCPLWFFANYFFNVSLNLTSISSNTILSSTSGIFTLLFTIIFLGSHSNAYKWLSVLISFGGVICIGLSESNEGDESLVGDLFAILGAMLYAGYSVCLKGLGEIDTVLLFGCVGVINCFALLPGIFLLNSSGVEVFEAPEAMDATLILGNALIGSMVCDLMFAWSVDYLTPAVCTLGLSLTIPLSMLVDSVLKKVSFSSRYYIGAGMILVGFIMISIVEEDRKDKDLDIEGSEDRELLIAEI
ncbi:hypothetical protein SteCoe_27141 [Stentor coeruleus]|uniref:Sugar phosphate transporter domain-containing protein n=1 Tax=Stentor coeruleus TaxID=5963 RepID=A0A1R2BB82_9CILI|nr:hypothetical protein SteCoe_27141 [Stentor coeruleus]